MANMQPALLILVTGDPVPPVQREFGGFAELIRRSVGDSWQGNWVVRDARSEELPAADDWAGVIITGSPASLTERAPWMEATLTYVRELVERSVPTFGICFGHQLLAEALGGRVERNPAGREIGSVMLQVNDPQDSKLLHDDSGPGRSFIVNMTHLDTVVRLPTGAKAFASTPQEPHAFVQFGPAAWGVQFHPEMDADVMRHYIQYRQEDLAAEGRDVSQLLVGASETPHSRWLLEQFAATCSSQPRPSAGLGRVSNAITQTT
jgi:GMP synthase (glutamine-hydrolysing)